MATSVFADGLYKVVYHVDFEDADRYSATLTSINNMITVYENELNDYEVSIVFVGLGARYVTDSPKAGETKRLKERRAELKGRLTALQTLRKVNLSVCNNSLEGYNLTKEDIYKDVLVVESGVVYLAKLQTEGASYLKIQ